MSGFQWMEHDKILKVCPGKFSRNVNNETTTFAYDRNRKSAIGTESVMSLQVIFKVYLKFLKLSKACIKFIQAKTHNDVYLKVKWHIFGFEDSVTSPERLMGNKVKIDFTNKYKLDVDEDLAGKLNRSPMIFKLYAVSDNKELFLGKGEYTVEDIYEYNNVKQEVRIYFGNYAIDPTATSIVILPIWYKFSCNQSILNQVFQRREADITTTSSIVDETTKSSHSTIRLTNSEIANFQDGLTLVLNRNKVLKTTQSEISNEFNERVNWLHNEANWKLTLQENSILHGKDPNDVTWRQWREENTAHIKVRTYSQKPEIHKPELTITIDRLHFIKNSGLIRNKEVELIFVEYSLLNMQGPEFETPISLSKPLADEELKFDFSKTFPIHIEENYDHCKLLAKMIKNEESIRFLVVNEPKEDPRIPFQICKEIAFAEVRLSDLVQLESNVNVCQYKVFDSQNTNDVVGSISVKFEGIQALRRMALLILAPSDYQIYL